MFFTNCTTVEEIKARYKELAKQHHPDLGGDEEIMKQVNAEYHAALNGKHETTNADGFKYYYNLELEQAIMDQIGHLLAQLKDFDVNLWLVGRWIWIDGDTKAAKDTLKANDCRWAPKHKRWYWRHESDRSRGRGGNFSSIASKYGMTGIKEGNKPERKQLNRKPAMVTA